MKLVTIVQIVIALGIMNVWLLRFGKPTSWRGGTATNMREEFEVYGLPGWFMGVVGFLKLLFATMLLAGISFPALTKPAAMGLGLLMLGAIGMHLKVGDPLPRSLPASVMLLLCLFVAMA